MSKFENPRKFRYFLKGIFSFLFKQRYKPLHSKTKVSVSLSASFFAKLVSFISKAVGLNFVENCQVYYVTTYYFICVHNDYFIITKTSNSCYKFVKDMLFNINNTNLKDVSKVAVDTSSNKFRHTTFFVMFDIWTISTIDRLMLE